MDISEFNEALRNLACAGGPCEHQYEDVVAFIDRAAAAVDEGNIRREDIRRTLDELGAIFTEDTIQGRGLRKPHGYAGDFEMLECIYLEHVSKDPHLAKWDRFFHWNPAPKAVRNRKSYFHRVLDQLAGSGGQVLKLGVGPGRGMHEWMRKNPQADITIDCVDIDPKAIQYARELNAPDSGRIRFHQANAIKFSPPDSPQYQLIWAAGLFDYFDDATFVRVARRYFRYLAPGGTMIIGNFAENNPSRPYMELFGEWYLHHRTPQKLYALGREISPESDDLHVDSEDQGVNLFLHLPSAS